MMDKSQINNVQPEQMIVSDMQPILPTSSPAIGNTNVVGSFWSFLYNSCIHESSSATVSLHYTKEGAEKAMALHKEEKRKQWQKVVDSDEDKGTEFGFENICPFGIHEDWAVATVEVLP